MCDTDALATLGDEMFASVWEFVQDESNRALISWVGGGIVVVIGGLWAVFKFSRSKQKPEVPPPPTVSASGGGVAAGRDIRNTEIDTRGGSRR
jgi:hypothetical protein